MTASSITANNKFLKNILTTASTLALVMGSSGEAGATGAVAVNMSGLGTNNTITQLITGNVNKWAVFDDVGQNLVFDFATNLAGAFMTKSGTMTVDNSVSIGSISNGGTGGSASITVADGKTLTLTGGTYGVFASPGTTAGGGNSDYSGVGSIVLGTTTGGSASSLTVTGSTGGIPTYYFPINSLAGAANPGILNVNDAVLFQSATIGGTVPLSAINITNGGTWQAGLTSAVATKINLTSGTSVVRLWGGTITGDIHNTSGGVGATAVNIEGGESTLKGNIGAGTSADTWVSALHFVSNVGLIIDSTSARAIYAPITTAGGANGWGGLKLNGTNNITLFGNVGTSIAPLSFISFRDDNKLIIDSTSGVRDIYSVIQNDGTVGQGTLSTTGSNSMIFHHYVGAVGALGTIDLTANTGGTITFNRYVDATTIKVGARPVVFASTTDRVSGAIQLCNTASQVTFSTSAGPLTGNITNTSGSLGSTKVNISGADVTFAGSVGASGAANGISSLYFATDNILTMSGTRDIYAYIIPSTNGQGTLKLSGGTTTLHYNVGTYTGVTPDAALKAINVNDQTLVIDSDIGNFYVAGQITTTSAGKGILTTQGANTVNLFNDIGNGVALAAINVNTNTTLNSGTINATTINIASGKTLTIDSTTGTRSITGIINGASDNVGTLVLTRGTNAITINSDIGTTHPLSIVRFSKFNNGSPAALSHNVRATTLDLIGTSIVGLDANATNITNFTSTDNNGYVYYNGAGALTVNNIAVPLTLHSTGTLTASNATGGVTFNGNSGNTPTFIAANNASISDVTVLGVSGVGTFRTAGNATFAGSIGSSTYSLAALTLTGTAGQTVAMNSATDIYATNITHSNVTLDTHANDIVMHGNYSSNNAALTLGTKKITFSSGNTATLAGTLVINATYTGTGQTVLDLSGAASLDASAVTTLTLNIDNGTLTPVSNDVINVIKAPGSITLPTNMTVSMGTSDTKWHVTSFGVLTYDPPVVVFSSSVAAPNIPTTTLGVSVVGASSANIAQAVLKLGNAAQIDKKGIATFKTTNLTSLTTDQVNPLASQQTLSLPTISNLTVLNTLVSVGSSTTKVNSSVAAYTSAFNTTALQNGWLGAASNTIVADPNLTLDSSFTQAFAIIASEADLIPNSMADAIINPEKGGTSQELVDTMVKVAATEGRAVAQDMINRTGSATSDNTLNIVNARQSNIPIIPPSLPSYTQSDVALPPQQSAPRNISVPSAAPVSSTNTLQDRPQITSDEDVGVPGDDLQAVAYGMAAGSSPYDKYGVWMSLNAGKAKQKALKGTSGFNSHSEGFALGVDTMINERTSIGVTVSNTLNHVKHKDDIIGNKTDSSSWVGAVYGNRQLKNDWFIRGAALFNRTRMNSKELRRIQGGYGVAQAKYNLISYGGEVSVGFAHRFKNELIITPSIGFRMLHNNKLSYGQEGSTYQNNKSSTNAIDNYSALGGLSLSKTISKYSIEFTPEAHVNVQYGVNQKTPTGTFVSALTPNQTTNFIGTKADKIISTYGLGLTGSNERFECGITGDVSIANKYVGYQGSLKLKVKF